jgi:hypothetical protein
MRFMNVTAPQLLMLALVISIISGVTSAAASLYMDYRVLPIVYKDTANTCIKVENIDNGHAFNCNDVDVTLRRYRLPEQAGETNLEEIPTPDVHKVQP